MRKSPGDLVASNKSPGVQAWDESRRPTPAGPRWGRDRADALAGLLRLGSSLSQAAQ
jgi:hypothetical protein